MINVIWTWNQDLSSRQINDNFYQYKTNDNENDHVWNQTTEKENRSREIYKAYRSFNSTKKLEKTNKKIKNPSTSYDDIEHSTNNNRSLLQQPENPSGINHKFFALQNQAAFDRLHTTSNEMKGSSRFCARLCPFRLEYCIL